MSTEVRESIEKIGGEILKEYCQSSSTSKPIMIPPVPDSNYLEKLPDGELEGEAAEYKYRQYGYEAEVKVYRCFEDLERNVIVIHQIKYTHGQYSAFVPQHDCTQKNCTEKPVHPCCHLNEKGAEGETDFVVIGHDFVAVFEVKGLTVSKYQTCCSELLSKCSIKRNGIKLSVQERNAIEFEKDTGEAARQRSKMVNLIKHLKTDLNVSIHIHQFSIFPNISKEEVDEGYLSDTTLLFSEDIETFTSWFDANISSSDTDPENINSAMISVKRSLLGLWCIKTDNKGETSDCSLSKCIMDIDRKLERALVTKQAIDQDKSKYKSQEKYPNNPVMVDAPDLFKKYLKINRLTQEQLDVFNCKERFLWVEGPTGSGKTILMLGKIIDTVLNKNTEDRVLVMVYGQKTTPAVRRYHEVLDNINEDIKCSIVEYDYRDIDDKVGDIDDKVAAAEKSLMDKLSTCKSRIVILVLGLYDVLWPWGATISSEVYDFITSRFNHVFVDDYQTLNDHLKSDELFPGVKNSPTNNTRLWVFCDNGQSFLVLDISTSSTGETRRELNEFRNMFESQKVLSVNLRNTYEISSVLSVIREHYNTKGFPGARGAGMLGLPQQNIGHFLRGTKPTIYLVRDDNPNSCEGILEKELRKLRGPDSCLKDEDIAVLYVQDEEHSPELLETVDSVLKKLNMDIEVRHTFNCISAEWPASVFIQRCSTYSQEILTLPVNSESKKLSFYNTMSFLHNALSRARVYSTAILYNYGPNAHEYKDNNMLSKLGERRDICRIVE